MAENQNAGDHAARRNRSIRRAMGTSFLSKAGTALLQLVSIPIAIRVLGRAEFGLYASVNITLATVSMLQIGIGPALAHGLAKAQADNDDQLKKRLASTAWLLMLGMAGLATLLCVACLATIPVTTIYGDAFAGKEHILRPALWLGLGLFTLLFVLNLTDRLREGCLEADANNLWGAVGNVCAALAVGIGVRFLPEVWYLVLAIHGSNVLAKSANTLGLWKRHPVLRPALSGWCPATARHLFTDGLAFTSCALITGLIEYNFVGWMAGRTGGLTQVALYSVFISLTVFQLGFIMMVSTPTWPAVAEAMARDDRPWARKAAKRLYLYGAGFAVASGIGLVSLGPWLFPLWLGPEFKDVGRATIACYSAYFLAHAWRHIGHTMMIGTGQVARLARIQLVESLAIAGLATLAMRQSGVPATLLAMATAIFCITGWSLPRLVQKSLNPPH